MDIFLAKGSVTCLLRKVIYANNLLLVLMRKKKSNNWIKWLLQFDLSEEDEKKCKCSKCSIIKCFDDEISLQDLEAIFPLEDNSHLRNTLTMIFYQFQKWYTFTSIKRNQKGEAINAFIQFD